MAINSLLVIFGVFVLRQREALDESHIHNKEGFQIPLFPLPPIILLFITTWTLIYLAMENPIEIAFSAGVIITGALGYFLTRKLSL